MKDCYVEFEIAVPWFVQYDYFGSEIQKRSKLTRGPTH
jgi:hypothetical protein